MMPFVVYSGTKEIKDKCRVIRNDDFAQKEDEKCGLKLQ